jgi:hypothetical protein
MEPVTLLLNALVAGAAAALKPTAEKAVKDAYEGLKSIIKRKSSGLGEGVDYLEKNPGAKPRQQALETELATNKVAADEETLRAAKQVLEEVAKHDERAAEVTGITIEQLHAGASIDIKRMLAEKGPVNVRGLTAGQDIRLGDIISGNPPRR